MKCTYLLGQLLVTGYFLQRYVAVLFDVLAHQLSDEAVPTCCTRIEAGTEQGHRDPGEGGHQGTGCHWHQHFVKVSTGVTAALVLWRASACHQKPDPGICHVAEQEEDEGWRYDEGTAIQGVPGIARTLEDHGGEDILAGSCQQGHNAVTQKLLVADTKIHCSA